MKSETQIIESYFKSLKRLETMFKYTEDWSIFPWADYREYYWFIEKGREIKHLWYNGYDGKMIFWNSIEEVDQENIWYEHDIYTQRHLPKWVYESKEYTMVLVDTKSDGNKLLAVLDNKKKFDILPKEVILARTILAD